MKKIIIKRMSLLNFKGIRALSIDFDAKLTEISGKNGVGKSTIFDAFCWLLFGKNASDSKQFTLKTTDADGIAIPRIPHEVEALISVNGTDITIKRCFTEKWTKKRGEAVEQFTGHIEERYFNDVPFSASEYDAKVRDICTEEVFKYITNPSYFPTRKEDTQRKLLFDMVGGVSDADVALGNEDFTRLLDELSGKTMDEFKREIGAKKKRVKAEVEAIPQRIDERERDIMQEPESTTAAENELAEKKSKLSEVESQIADSSKAYQAASNARLDIVREIAALKVKKTQTESDIIFAAQSDYRRAMSDKRAVEDAIASQEREEKNAQSKLAELKSKLAEYQEQRKSLLDTYKRLTAEINAADVPMNESQFICPTCGRRYEVNEIEEKQKEITERYVNGKIAERNANIASGKALKERIETAERDIEKLDAKLAELDAKLAESKNDARLTVSLTEPDGKREIAESQAIRDLDARIAELQVKADAPVEAADDTELKEARTVLSDNIEHLKSFISQQQRIADDNKRNKARIAELEKQLQQQNEELARLEQIEFTILSFSKARTRAIEDKINSLFSLVKFKLFETQINGAEIECCVPMINGVPYSDANTAGRINAGLDIINAISRAQDIEAPIFIDGAESINRILDTDSQKVTLTVTTEEMLTVNSRSEQNLFK